jgi:hypothetical protein
MILGALLTACLGQALDAGAIGERFGHDESARCQSCHPRHYAEWMGSLHAAVGRRSLLPHGSHWHPDRGGDLADPSCKPCHGGGLTALLGARPIGHHVRLDHAAERSITCVVCHQVRDVFERAPPPAAPAGKLAGAPATRPDADRFHRESKPLSALRRPDFCGPCHQVRSPNGLDLERTYSQFLESPFAARQDNCVVCHMVGYAGEMVAGGRHHGQLHRHDFIGADAAVHALPAVGPQHERVRLFLESAAALFLHAPERVAAGGSCEVEVEVVNSGAGHNFPAGFPKERRLWIEVEAALDDGTRVFASGLGRAEEREDAADSQLADFTDRFLDAAGKEVAFWWEAAAIEERSLKALERRVARYRFQVPEAAIGKTLRVEARLRFQASSPEQLRRLGLESLLEKFPVFVVRADRSAPIPVVAREFPESAIVVPDDAADLQEAISRAAPGGQVLVRPGVYRLSRTLMVPGGGLMLRSLEGAASTQLVLEPDAEAGPEAPASVISIEVGGDPPSRIEGFTIRGGRGTLHQGRRSGGGLFIAGASPAIVRCRIEGNAVEGDGGGVFLADSGAVLEECALSRNRAGGSGGGIAVEGASAAALERCVLAGNAAGDRGGGLRTESALAAIDCEIRGNQAGRGGGAAIDGVSDFAEVELRRSRILGNAAPLAGGLLIADAAARVEESVIAGNLARIGAGIYVIGARASDVEGCTITENESVSGAAVRCRDEDGAPRIRNSIVWGNRGPELTGSVEYSLVDLPDLAAGTNSGGFPVFERAPGLWQPCASLEEPGCVPVRWTPGRTPQPAAYGRWEPGRYHLLLDSAAIDRGDPAAAPDPDGTRRDIGAHYRPRPLRGFIRGDLDGDGAVDLADARELCRVFSGERGLECDDAADFDDRSGIGPADLVALIIRGFGAPLAPERPFPACGVDPTPDDGVGCFEDQARCR